MPATAVCNTGSHLVKYLPGALGPWSNFGSFSIALEAKKFTGGAYPSQRHVFTSKLLLSTRHLESTP
jgi:hypothetical protein